MHVLEGKGSWYAAASNYLDWDNLNALATSGTD